MKKIIETAEIFGGNRVPASILLEELPKNATLVELLEIRSMAPSDSPLREMALAAIPEAEGTFDQWKKAFQNALIHDDKLCDVTMKGAIAKASDI